MITKKLFLASSAELKEDRNQFEIFINRKNKDWVEKGVFIHLVIWEDFLDAMSKTRLQDEYNNAIRECDLFVMLFWTKVGQYTEEEFETAFGQFKATNKPFIFTYFKDAEINPSSASREDWNSRWAFMDKLNALGHFYTVYKNIHELMFNVNQQLDKHIKFETVTSPLLGAHIHFRGTDVAREIMPVIDSERQSKVQDFTGRQWLLAEIRNWFNDNDASPTLLLEGDAGVGKTAAAAKLVAECKDSNVTVAYHFCVANQDITLDPINFCFCLHSQLPIPQTEHSKKTLVDQLGEVTAFNHLVMSPLSRLAAGNRLLIVVDSLDEATETSTFIGQKSTIVDLLRELSTSPIQNVRLLTTARPDRMGDKFFRRLTGNTLCRRLNFGDKAFIQYGRQDVFDFATLRLQRSEAIARAVLESGMFNNKEHFASAVADASTGNFQYAKFLCDDVEKTRQVIATLGTQWDERRLPQGLEQLYFTYLENRSLGRSWRQNCRFAGTLAAARAPFTRDEIWKYSVPTTGTTTTNDLEEFLEHASQFLSVISGLKVHLKRFSFYHQSFADFFLLGDGPFHIDSRAANAQIGLKAAYDNGRIQAYRKLSEYEKNHTLFHLRLGEKWESVIELVSRQDFFDGRLDDGRDAPFVLDLIDAYRSCAGGAEDSARDFAPLLVAAVTKQFERREGVSGGPFKELIDRLSRGTKPTLYDAVLDFQFERGGLNKE
jgi:hypothetical protein